MKKSSSKDCCFGGVFKGITGHTSPNSSSVDDAYEPNRSTDSSSFDSDDTVVLIHTTTDMSKMKPSVVKQSLDKQKQSNTKLVASTSHTGFNQPFYQTAKKPPISGSNQSLNRPTKTGSNQSLNKPTKIGSNQSLTQAAAPTKIGSRHSFNQYPNTINTMEYKLGPTDPPNWAPDARLAAIGVTASPEAAARRAAEQREAVRKAAEQQEADRKAAQRAQQEVIALHEKQQADVRKAFDRHQKAQIAKQKQEEKEQQRQQQKKQQQQQKQQQKLMKLQQQQLREQLQQQHQQQQQQYQQQRQQRQQYQQQQQQQLTDILDDLANQMIDERPTINYIATYMVSTVTDKYQFKNIRNR